MTSGNEHDHAATEPARPVHDTPTVVPGAGSDLIGGSRAVGEFPTPAGVAELDEFATALVEIGLISRAELESFAGHSALGVLGLSRALVKAGKLTPYQAAAIYQKKSRGLLIGNYLILDKLGQGGMGVVFKARHRRLERIGALKILPPSYARDRDAVMRFRREVEAAGRLKHPNLVAGHDASEDRGVHYLVMDYVEGRDLDRLIQQQGPLPVHKAVEYLIQAARGLEAAHAQGIIHRDIKPANLMLDTAETVRVLDLGLARIVDAGNAFNKTAAGRLTQSGMYMGTIDFMAPEQAEDSHTVDHRADIYSLGCTFFYLLTGREPFPAETILKRLMAHVEKEAPSLREIRPDVSPALETIYRRMMAKKPRDRPASMTEVIALLQASKLPEDDVMRAPAPAPKSRPELKVFNETPLKRAGTSKTKAEPSIFAKRDQRQGSGTNHELDFEDLVMDVRSEVPAATFKPPPAEPVPLKRSAHRHSHGQSRRTAAAVALAAAAVLAAAFVRFVLYHEPISDRGAPQVVAEAVVDSAPDPEPEPAVAAPPPPELPVIDAGRSVTTVIPPKPALAPSVEASPVRQPPTDARITIAQGAWLLDNARGTAESATFSPDGLWVLSGHEDQTVRLWDWNSGRIIHRFGGRRMGRFMSVAFSPDGTRVLAGGEGKILQLWNVSSGKLVRSFRGHRDWILVVAYSPDGRHVASAGGGKSLHGPGSDFIVRLWDVETDSAASRLTAHKGEVLGLAFSPDGRHLLSGGEDRATILWDVQTGLEVRRFVGHSKQVECVAFLRDGRRAVSSGYDRTIRLWEIDSGHEIRRFLGHSTEVTWVAVTPDGRYMLSSDFWGHELRFWDIDAGALLERIDWGTTSPTRGSFSPDGRHAVWCGTGGVVRLYSLSGAGGAADLQERPAG